MKKVGFWATNDVAEKITQAKHVANPDVGIEDFNAVLADIDRLEMMATALESYEGILEASLERGGADDATIRVIKTAVESFDEDLAGGKVIPSIEAFGQTNSRKGATLVSVESLGDKLKATGEAIKKAIAKLFDILLDLWNILTDGLGRAEKRLLKLKGELKSLKSSAGSKVSVSNRRLMAEGKFVGNDPASITILQEVASDMWGGYLKNSLTAAKEFAAAAKRDGAPSNVFLHKNLTSSTNTHYTAHDRTLPSFVRRHADELNSTIKASKVLPGDYALIEFRHKTSTTRQEGSSVYSYTGYAKKVMFTPLSEVSSPQVMEVPVPSRHEMEAVVDALLKVTALRKQQQSGSRTAREIRQVLSEVSRSSDDREVATRAMFMARTFTQPSGQFSAYMAKTVNAYVSHLRAMVEVHETSGSAVTTSTPTSVVPA
jgi:hypothetical protein